MICCSPKTGWRPWTGCPSPAACAPHMHHNNYQGFFALRPAYLLDGDAELLEFEYKPL